MRGTRGKGSTRGFSSPPFHHPLRLRLGVLLVSLFFTAATPAAELASVEALIKGGATELALTLINQEQTGTLPREQWAAWERARLMVYAAQGDWDALARRVEQLPSDLPPEFTREALTRAAEARLHARDPAGARRFLRRLIWGEAPAGGGGKEGELAYARRLVIRSYLLEGRLADALTALTRYKQDYRARDEPWQVLHAEILVRAGQPRAAFEELVGRQSHEARLLRLFAGLQAGYYRPREVVERARELVRALQREPLLRRQAWLIAAEAARQGNDDAGYVHALEQALALPAAQDDSLFKADADALWRAYEQLAEALGNAARLLVGEDEKWLAKAESYSEQAGVQRRALYAFLAHTGQDPTARRSAHQRLAASLAAEGLTETLKALYMRSARYPELGTIPEPVRLRLADVALAEYDIRLAATLIKDLAQPLEGDDPQLWQLRRARILVYAGEVEPALQLLLALLDEHGRLEADLAGRYLQVVFDLQTAGRHEAAIRLLESLYTRADNERLQRELLFWLADSHAALGRHRQAAELYLRSSVHGGANGDDPWGQTARYHAAGQLGKAGLLADARNVYLGLLRVTADARRRLEIERRIQELWLTRHDATMP